MKRIREQSFRESRNTSFRHTQRRDYNFLKDFIEVHIRRLHIHVFSSSLFVWQISGNISVLLFRALCILRRFLGKEYIALYHVSYSIITHSSFSNSRIRPSKKYRSIASWSSSMATTCYVNNIERRFFSRFPNSFKSDWPRAFFFFLTRFEFSPPWKFIGYYGNWREHVHWKTWTRDILSRNTEDWGKKTRRRWPNARYITIF